MTKLIKTAVFALFLTMPVMGQDTVEVVSDFDNPADGVAGWSVSEAFVADIDLTWVNDHPDNGSLGALRAIVNFGSGAGCCPSFNVGGILFHEADDVTAVADSLTYDIYLPSTFPDGRRAYLAIAGDFSWVWRHDAFKTMGTPYDASCTGNYCNEPGADLVAGAWNTLMFPIADAIAAGHLVATDTIRAGFKTWAPSAWEETDTLYIDNMTVWGIGTLLATEAVDAAPKAFQLSRAYPNPFNPVTHLDYKIAEATEVTMIVYDIIGQRVKTLVSGQVAAGSHRVSWDGTDDAGDRVASGVYLMRMTTSNFTQTQKFTLMK